jgi:hypothetical protein
MSIANKLFVALLFTGSAFGQISVGNGVSVSGGVTIGIGADYGFCYDTVVSGVTTTTCEAYGSADKVNETFESGSTTLSALNGGGCGGANVAVNTTRPYLGSYSAEIVYSGSSCDRGYQKSYGAGLGFRAEHWIANWFYFATPSVNPTSDTQRKLFYFNPSTGYEPSLVLTSDECTVSSAEVYGPRWNYHPNFGGVAISSISRSSNVVSVTLASAHGYATGASMNITGVSPVTFNDSAATITVTDSTHFTYANTGSDESGSGGFVGKVLSTNMSGTANEVDGMGTSSCNGGMVDIPRDTWVWVQVHIKPKTGSGNRDGVLEVFYWNPATMGRPRKVFKKSNTWGQNPVRIASATRSGTTLTIDTVTAHNLSVNDWTIASSMTAATGAAGSLNGNRRVVGVTDTDTVTFTVTAGSDATATALTGYIGQVMTDGTGATLSTSSTVGATFPGDDDYSTWTWDVNRFGAQTDNTPTSTTENRYLDNLCLSTTGPCNPN